MTSVSQGLFTPHPAAFFAPKPQGQRRQQLRQEALCLQHRGRLQRVIDVDLGVWEAAFGEGVVAVFSGLSCVSCAKPTLW